MESLTVSTILNIAFAKISEETMFTQAQSTPYILAMINELRLKIQDKFRSNERAEAALKAFYNGSQEDLDTVASYLQELMQQQLDFALEICVLALEIQTGHKQNDHSMTQTNQGNATGFQIQVNDDGTVNIYNHPVEKPINPVKRIPHTGTGTKHFVGRSEELDTIHKKLYEEQNTVAISAVAGMGGVGKTELAVKYARQHENDYHGGVCWFGARGSNITTEILTFAKNYLKLEVPQKDFHGQPLTLKQQIDWCWDNWQPPEGLVLVIFDDVTSLKNFHEYLPTSNRFRVLITTRLRDIDTNIEQISLDVLSPEEALKLLTNLIGENKVNKDIETAKKICKWLGYLPLGIELLGRYISKKPPHFTLAKMLELLKNKRLEQEAINPKDKNLKNETLSTAQLGVKAAFELSWLELDEQTQKVAALLSLFAADIFVWEWVESIIESLNKTNTQKSKFKILSYLKFWDQESTQKISYSEADVNAALEQLYQRYLINGLEESNTYYYKIHTLIREFLQEKLVALPEAEDFKRAFAHYFIEIAQSIPDSVTIEIITRVKNAIPHLAVVAENLIDSVSNENLIWAFIGSAKFYSEQGLYVLAEPWCKQCISLLKSRLGENHPFYASSVNNLAYLYKSQGKYDEAEPLFIQALNLKKRILGENHLDYALSLNDLAGLYKSQGKYEEAEPLYIQVLELRKRILGENHPDYASSLNNLASLYDSQGKYDEAESLYIRALKLTKRIQGENHPSYATSLNNLAYLYKSQGKYEEAEPLYIQALELRKRTLGENHPHYASSLNNLASLYNSQGKYEEAEPLYIQALELIKRILGENHPSYATSLNNLAELYRSQGKYKESEPLYIQALELKKRILGENHPSYATSLNNLAGLCKSQGKYDEAEPLFIQALKLTERILGENHPHYATSLNNLAELYRSQGQYEKAEPLFIQALELRKRILGKNHPHYATSLNNLAELYRSQGKYEEAEPFFIQSLELIKHILGENHPDYARSLNNLAELYRSQGKYEEAEPFFIQALKIAELSLGINHPNTITIRKNLESLQNNLQQNS